MAKRFTETDKWDDDWYLGLPPKMKLAWSYLSDKCDGCGLIKISFSLISFRIKDEVTRADFDQHFAGRVTWVSHDTLWLHGFIKAQYKKLSSRNPAHLNMAKKILESVNGDSLADKAAAVFDSLLTLVRLSDDPPPTLDDPPADPRAGDIGNRKKEIGKNSSSLEKGSGEKPLDLESTASEIFESIPILTRDTLLKKYPAEFLKSGIEECVTFHLNEPGSAKWQPGVWGKKFTSWMITKKQRERGRPKETQAIDTLELRDFSAKEGA